MAKKNKSVFGIFTEAIGLYFSNFDKFLKYMTFPVLGQILGLILVFVIMYFYSKTMPELINKYPSLNDYTKLIGISIVVTLPGLAIFCKAFWEYLVSYGAINSMLENMLRSGRVYDFEAHTELIKRRAISFVGLWFLFSVFAIAAICPLFWIICGVFAVYFVLSFQVFTFEPEQSPIGCVKRSFMLIKGRFKDTFWLIFLLGVLTYLLIPQIITKSMDGLGFTALVSGYVLPLANTLPELNLEAYGLKPITSMDIAFIIVQAVATQIIIEYTLPLRSILWSLWYKELNGGISTDNYSTKVTKNSKKSKKRPSEILMEESNKKFSKKKLDTNILKRASEKDE